MNLKKIFWLTGLCLWFLSGLPLMAVQYSYTAQNNEPVTGRLVLYDESGQALTEELYVDGFRPGQAPENTVEYVPRKYSLTYDKPVTGALKLIDDELGIVVEEMPLVEGRPHGLAVVYNSHSDTKSEQMFYNGAQTGPYKTYYLADILLEEGFKAGGLKYGLIKVYDRYTGGLKSEVFYTGDLYGGAYRVYNSLTGKLWMDNRYCQNQPLGPSRYYHSNGQLMTEEVTVGGCLKVKGYYADGRLMGEGEANCGEGQSGGWVKEYYADGLLRSEALLAEAPTDQPPKQVKVFDREGRLRGELIAGENPEVQLVKMFDEEGRLTAEIPFNSLYGPDGEAKYFDPDGQVVRRLVFSKGKSPEVDLPQ